MNFTREEVSLCKKIALRARKKLIYGDWWKGTGEDIFLMNIPGEILHPVDQHKDIIPLWTISDCLEFLRKKPGLHTLEITGDYHRLRWHVISNWTDIAEEGETPLEAFLKAVLAVIEEKS